MNLLYFEHLPMEVSFADVMKPVQKRNEVALGLKVEQDESDSAKNFGINLIPEKNTRFHLQPDKMNHAVCLA